MALPRTDTIRSFGENVTIIRILKALKIVGVLLMVALLIYGFNLVNNQSQALGRRAPTLAYMACHDQASDNHLIAISQLQAAQAHQVQILVDINTGERPASDAKIAKAEIVEAEKDLAERQTILMATTDPSQPLYTSSADENSPHRCPELPS